MPRATKKKPTKASRTLIAKYIDKVSNPRTPEDLLLALQDPSSPAYKDLLKGLIEQLDMHEIIEQLVQKYIIQQYVATQIEKLEMIEAQYKQPKTDDYYLQLLEERHDHELSHVQFGLEIIKLFAGLIKEYDAGIATLTTDVAQLHEDIKTLEQKADKNTMHWKVELVKQEMNFVERLAQAKEPIQLIPVNGSPLDPKSEKGRQLIQQAFTSPAPLQILNMLIPPYPQEVVKAQQVTHANLFPSSDSPEDRLTSKANANADQPLLPFTPQDMAKKNCVMNELRLAKGLAEGGKNGGTGSDILEAIRNNREAFNLLPGAPRMEMKPGQTHAPDEEVAARAKLYEEAMKIKRAELSTRENLSQKEAQLATIQSRREEAMAVVTTARAQLAAEPEKHESPRPSRR